MQAIWKGVVIAESDDTTVIEGNHYFPPSSIHQSYFKPSSNETHTTCPWKGVASYYDVEVNGEVNKDAAWFYPSASELAKNFENYIAFWKGVEVK